MNSSAWVYTSDGGRFRMEVTTLVPTMSMRWFTDYDGDRLLQQKFTTPAGASFWINVPEAGRGDE